MFAGPVGGRRPVDARAAEPTPHPLPPDRIARLCAASKGAQRLPVRVDERLRERRVGLGALAAGINWQLASSDAILSEAPSKIRKQLTSFDMRVTGRRWLAASRLSQRQSGALRHSEPEPYPHGHGSDEAARGRRRRTLVPSAPVQEMTKGEELEEVCCVQTGSIRQSLASDVLPRWRRASEA